MKSPLSTAAVTLLAIMLVACNGVGPTLNPERSQALAREASDASTVPGPDIGNASASYAPSQPVVDKSIERAIIDPRRPVADRHRDRDRKAAQVLQFFQIHSGMTVLDLYSGGGYYTEILSYVVGPAGRVVAHNDSTFAEKNRQEIAERYAPGRLPNVEQLRAENNQLSLPADTFDAVLIILAYHDFYRPDEAGGWRRIDRPKLLAQVYKALKPGGVLGIVDHVARAGAPAETGGTLHRIDPALLRRDVTAAGFRLEAQSDILRNPSDDHSLPVFDPQVRGHTDQVVMRFRKPR